MPPLKDQKGYAEGERLLAMTAAYDTARINPEKQPGQDVQAIGFMVVLFIVRARRLVRAIGKLVQVNLFMEAESLNRTLFEHAVTGVWICTNPGENRKRWILNDYRGRLEWDAEYEEFTRPEGGTEGDGDRLIEDEAERESLDKLARQLEGQGVKRMPDLRGMLQQLDRANPGHRYEELYVFLYRHWSKSAEHALPLAMERFSSGGSPSEGWTMDAFGEGAAGVDPYETAVLSFHWLLDAVQAVQPGTFKWKAALDEVQASLMGPT